MKYLFFDIECSNCFGGKNKICEFGYVITDEKFNVIRKGDIPMSPGDKNNRSDRFDVSIYKREPGFQWAYDFDYYFSCKKFPAHYERIKKLFEDEDTMVFGYSVGNDARYLDSEFQRYKLNPFKYKVCDIQIIMKYYSEKREKFMGLKDAFIKLCSYDEYIGLHPHLSRDDAYMTMRILQEMLKNLQLSLNDIIELCSDSYFDANEYLNKYHEKKRIKEITKKKTNPAQKLLRDFYGKYLEKLEDEESLGRFCSISSKLKDSENNVKDAIKYIEANNLIPIDSIGKSNYLLVENESDKVRLLNMFKYPFEGKFILIDEEKEKVIV